MNCLCLSTSESLASVALSWGEQEDHLSFDRQNSPAGERLIEKIDELLSRNGLGRETIERLGVNVGPGSFTGTRVGVATANGLGLGLRVPVAGFSSLDLIACEWFHENKGHGEIVTAVDAGRKQCFAAFYSLRNGFLEKTRPDALWDRADLMSAALNLPLAGWKLEDLGIPFKALCPSALSCARLLKTSPTLSFPSYALPNYVRATDAENNWLRSKNI